MVQGILFYLLISFILSLGAEEPKDCFLFLMLPFILASPFILFFGILLLKEFTK